MEEPVVPEERGETPPQRPRIAHIVWIEPRRSGAAAGEPREHDGRQVRRAR
jgi:hypothetical protein